MCECMCVCTVYKSQGHLLSNNEGIVMWMTMQTHQKGEIQARSLSAMSGTENLDLRDQKDCGPSPCSNEGGTDAHWAREGGSREFRWGVSTW